MGFEWFLGWFKNKCFNLFDAWEALGKPPGAPAIPGIDSQTSIKKQKYEKINFFKSFMFGQYTFITHHLGAGLAAETHLELHISARASILCSYCLYCSTKMLVQAPTRAKSLGRLDLVHDTMWPRGWCHMTSWMTPYELLHDTIWALGWHHMAPWTPWNPWNAWKSMKSIDF